MSDQRRVAIVTGGTRGVGSGLALGLAHAGFDLALGYHGDNGISDDFAQTLKDAGATFVTVKGDVRNRQDVVALFDAAERELGSIDVVCANAGVEDIVNSLADISSELADLLIDTNFKGTVNTLQEAARRVIDGGSIIATGSTIERYPLANSAVYSATKAAVRVLAEALAHELASRSVRVNVLAPGVVARAGIFTEITEEDRTFYTGLTPLRQLVEPNDLGAVVAFLVSPAARLITAQTMTINGGGRP